jgi:PKD repeat protein
MYLNFKTDGAGNSLGWTLKYSSVEKPDFDFGPDSKTICAGNSSTYTVTAKNGPATNWTYSWSLPGSSLSTSIAQSPTVNYGVEGVYSATVSVTNKAGTTTKTKNNVLTVKPQIAPNTAPYFEGFEGASFPVVNNDPSLTWTITADANTWTRNLLAPFSGVAAIRIRNATTKKDIRELVSPGFSLEGIPINEREILFKMAYARVSTAAAADQLRVLYSVNCGKTWVEVYKRSHTTTIKLSTIGDAATDVVASTFVPEPFQYRTETVSLASLPLSSPNVMIKFEMTSEKGNFLYLDDIRLTTNTSIENLTRANGLEISLRPNPSSNESTLFFRNATSPSLAVQLTDLTGRVLSTAQIAGLDGSSVQSASTSELFGKVPVGMYFIKVRTLGEEKIIRWIRN